MQATTTKDITSTKPKTWVMRITRVCVCKQTWEQRKLGDVATFGGGHTPSMNDESNYADGKILWVTSQDVKVDYLSDTTTKLSEKGASELKLYPPGTLLMVTRSGILRHTLPVSMLRKPSTVNQDIRTIISNEDCSSLWLMQHFKAHSKELLVEYGKTGTTVESVEFREDEVNVTYAPHAR